MPTGVSLSPALPRGPAGPSVAPSARQSVSVLIVDPNAAERARLQQLLTSHCALVEAADTLARADALRARCHFDLLLIDIQRPGSETLEWFQSVREPGPRADVILIADYADLDTAIAALRAGAADLLLKPFRDQQLLDALQRCQRHRQMLHDAAPTRPAARTARRRDSGGLLGDSRQMAELQDLVDRVAPTASTVLLQGETGTGKELVARAIHERSDRKGPFVALNCGAIAPELLESELFGHTRGAFTGAHAAREGLFSSAADGTIFLDEISEMPLAMQANLLRVLEERRIRPVGANREVQVSCRVIAATNRKLERQVAEGAFRQDLYYRLNVLSIAVPALRNRADDIPMLAEHFNQLLSRELGVPPVHFAGDDLQSMQSYPWPGNVRELRNLMERALLLGKLPRDCLVPGSHAPAAHAPGSEVGFPVHWSLAEVEKQHMLTVLDSVGGNKSEAARRLGVSRKTLERKLSAWSREEVRRHG